MERMYYNADSLAHMVEWYEERFGMTSEELLERHLAGERSGEIDAFERHVWLSFARELAETRATENVSHRFRRELVGA